MADKMQEAQKRLKERTASKRFKLPVGDTVFRVLPNAKGTQFKAYFEYGMHSEIGPRQAYMRCGKKMDGEGLCWLCDKILAKLEKSSKASAQSVAQKMRRQDKFAVQIAYKDDGDSWVGPVLWEMPPSVANKLLGMMGRREVDHPEKGYDLTISRTGTGRTDTKYENFEREGDGKKSRAPESVLKRLKPFSEVVRKYDEAAMKAAYYGHEQEEDEEEAKVAPEDEEEEKPRRKPKDEDEDETEKDIDVSEDEEEEKPKSGKKKPKEEDEDIEEALDEDIAELTEDEDEEKPKTGKKKPKEEEDESEEDEERPKGKKKPKHEDEDEEESAVVVEDEDEEEEKPKSGKKKPKPSSDDDDDE